MAAVVTRLGTATFNTTSGTKTVTATPAVGDLIIIITAHSGNTSTAAPTDNNSGGAGTYTLINTAVKATSADTMKAWVRTAEITAATSTVFTHAPGTTTGGGLVVISVSGTDKVGSAAIVQSAIQSNQAAGGTPAPVFGATPKSINAIIGAVFNASNPATITQRTNYTEIVDTGYNTPATGLEVMYDNSGETSATITWGSTSASAFASIAIEINTNVTHVTTGTVTGPGSTVSGTAVHKALHTTTGALAGPGAAVLGTAAHITNHQSTGALSGGGSAVAGTAFHSVLHPTVGVLAGAASVISGIATSYTVHSTTGALSGSGATVTGTADRQDAALPHIATGALTGPGSAVSGAATRYRTYTAVGALNGQGSQISGTADHSAGAIIHTASGSLTGAGSSISGTAAHNSLHLTLGTLAGQGTAISGSATRFRAHGTSGALSGQSSIISGSAVNRVLHVTAGTLVGQGPAITGAANRFRSHGSTGAITGTGSAVTGDALRSDGPTPHDASGSIVAAGASIFGQAERIGPTWPDPSQVLYGVEYGPTGNDYVGTYTCPGGGGRPIFIFDD